jgi:hypothetical protein
MRTTALATRALTAAALLVTLTTPAAQTGQAPLWLHVQIENEGGEDGGLHLPVAAVGALLQMAQAQGTMIENGQLRLGDEYLPALHAMRAVWQQLEAAGEGETVSAEYEGALIRVARVGERLEVHVEDGDRAAQGEVPAAVAEALLSGAEDALHIDAGLAALSALRGEAVQVTESNRSVRIWIDETPGQ